MTPILTYRNRTITQDDIAFIQKVIAEYHAEGRTAISRRICQAWNWQQVNGQLKDMVCRGLLLILERKQLISLPPRIKGNNNSLRHKKTLATIGVCQQPITIPLKDLTPIELRQVRRSHEEKLFNSLIQQFHYLGCSKPVGEHLKYLAFAGERLLACIAFSSAPYAITCRDSFIGWSPEARERNRHLLAYNTRFLILPWVRCPTSPLTCSPSPPEPLPMTGKEFTIIPSSGSRPLSTPNDLLAPATGQQTGLGLV